MEKARLARDIFLETLASINVRDALKKRLRLEGQTLLLDQQVIHLDRFRETVVIGFGKASLTMAAALEEILGNHLSRGLLVTDRRHKVHVKSEVIVSGHPVPDSNSLVAGNRIISMINGCGEDTLVFFLLSGGGSSLVEAPCSPEVKLEDIQRLNELLVGCGAKIKEINTIRKMFSRIKGGGLGYLARRLRSVAILVSDVNPGDLTSLASNPLLPEPAGLEEARSIIERYGLMERFPESVRRALEQIDSPARASWDWEGEKLSIISLLDNRDAMRAAARVAEGLGFTVELDFNNREGQYQSVAEDHINRILELQSLHTSKPVCLISGGEVSCPVKGAGAGGRNQEFVLYSATRLAAIESDSDIAVLSCGTDGIDGNSLAAGAVAGAELVRTAINQGVDITGFFERSDTHSFFRQFGGTVFTGPTGNNVRDIRILLSNPVSL